MCQSELLKTSQSQYKIVLYKVTRDNFAWRRLSPGTQSKRRDLYQATSDNSFVLLHSKWWTTKTFRKYSLQVKGHARPDARLPFQWWSRSWINPSFIWACKCQENTATSVLRSFISRLKYGRSVSLMLCSFALLTVTKSWNVWMLT